MNKQIIICIGRQLGSGGKEVGRILSEKLGVKLYDNEILSAAAEKSGFNEVFFANADEKSNPGIFGGLFGSTLTSKDIVSQSTFLSNDALFIIQSEAIKEIANRESSIFIGRCADYILRDNPSCLSVFVTASIEDRVNRICNHQKISYEDAIKIIRKADKQRMSYYNYFTDKTWGAAASYDLCISSSTFGIDGVVDTILDMLKRKLGKLK